MCKLLQAAEPGTRGLATGLGLRAEQVGPPRHSEAQAGLGQRAWLRAWEVGLV